METEKIGEIRGARIYREYWVGRTGTIEANIRVYVITKGENYNEMFPYEVGDYLFKIESEEVSTGGMYYTTGEIKFEEKGEEFEIIKERNRKERNRKERIIKGIIE